MPSARQRLRSRPAVFTVSQRPFPRYSLGVNPAFNSLTCYHGEIICAGRELNPHESPHYPLKVACLPFHHPRAILILFVHLRGGQTVIISIFKISLTAFRLRKIYRRRKILRLYHIRRQNQPKFLPFLRASLIPR